MDKKKARLRVGVLLDTCRDCVKAPKASVTGSIPVEVREEYCGTCSVYTEMAHLRKILDGKEISPAMPRKKRGSHLAITVEEFIQLNYVDKKTVSEIAESRGIDRTVIGNWKWRHKEEINKMLAEKGLTKADAADERGKHRKKKDNVASPPVLAPEIEFVHNPVEQAINWKEKYEEVNALAEGQKVEIKDLLTLVDGLRETLKEIQATNDLHAACEDIENELADVRKENGSLREENARFIDRQYKDSSLMKNQRLRIDSLFSDNNKLLRENKLLKELLKLWL
jgi:hypothetical protein